MARQKLSDLKGELERLAALGDRDMEMINSLTLSADDISTTVAGFMRLQEAGIEPTPQTNVALLVENPGWEIGKAGVAVVRTIALQKIIDVQMFELMGKQMFEGRIFSDQEEEALFTVAGSLPLTKQRGAIPEFDRSLFHALLLDELKKAGITPIPRKMAIGLPPFVVQWTQT